MTTPHELRKLAEKATRGPWQAICLGNDEYPSEVWYADNMRVCLMPSNVRGVNADYIAAANPQAILALLDQIEAMRKACRNITPYLKFTISDESPGHHPTMPSAVAEFIESTRNTAKAIGD